MWAIVIVNENRSVEGLSVPALIRIGGLSLLERQVRQLVQERVERVLIFGFTNLNVTREVERLKRLFGADRIGLETDLQTLLTTLTGQQDVVIVEASNLIDQRLFRVLVNEPRETIVCLSGPAVAALVSVPVYRALLDGREMALANAARLSVSRLIQENAEAFRSCFGAYLALLLAQHPSLALDIGTLDTYSYELRRHEPFLFFPIRSAADNSAAKRMLLNAAQKSVLDWPAWYLHRPIEKAIIFHWCEYPVTPNQLTILNNVVAFLGTYFFATGQWFWAMFAALSVGVLDGLDGKQARVKVMTSEIGKLEEVLDKIYENSWYLAIAYWLSTQGYEFGAYLAFGVILLCNLSDIVVGAIYTHYRHVQLDDAGDFERRFRVVSGRRNTYIWALVPFVAAALAGMGTSAYFAGFCFIAGYAVLTISIRIFRLATRLSEGTAV